jgi:hypothetical protein
MASSIDNLINVAFRKGQDLSGFGLKVGGKGDYRPPQFDAESLKFEYIDTNGSYGIDLNGSRFLQKLTFAESQTFTRATTGTFVGSNGLIQTAAIDAPRFTHDPVTREVQGLLIEEARTNDVLYSEDLTNAAWKKRAVTVTPNAGTAPNGTLTADKIIPSATTENHYLSSIFSASSGDVYTSTISVKADGYNFARLQRAGNNWATCSTVTINLVSGEFSALNGNVFVEKLTDGWFRIGVVGTVDADGSAGFLIGPTDPLGRNVNTTGDGVKGIFLWGGQFEKGSFPTSYIPTTGAQVTRAADNCVRTLGDEFNPESFTVFVDWSDYEGDTDNPGFFALDTGNDTLSSALYVFSSGGDYVIGMKNMDGDTLAYGQDLGSFQTKKIAISVDNGNMQVLWSTGDFSGVLPISDKAYSFNPLQLNIGNASSNAIKQTKLIVSKISVLPTALSEAELITLTGGN